MTILPHPPVYIKSHEIMEVNTCVTAVWAELALVGLIPVVVSNT